MEIAKTARRSDAITFVVFTYNEEKRLEWAIKNFLPWGRLLVVDNYSEDRTVEIAKSYGCEVLLNKNAGWVEDAVTVSRVKAAVQTEWIYWGFADELVSAETLDAIIAAVESGKHSIVNIARKNHYYGKFCYDAFADRLNRIFRKEAIDFSNNTIHLFGTPTVPESSICFLDSKRHYVHHYISYVAKNYCNVMDRYTDTQATGTADRFSGLSLWKTMFFLFARSAKLVVWNLLLRGGYKAGAAGLYLVLENVYYQWLLNMKDYERRNGLSVAEVERLNDADRGKLLNPDVGVSGAIRPAMR
jgi:glycosyltransferase involved in cell wall biosynthesis